MLVYNDLIYMGIHPYALINICTHTHTHTHIHRGKERMGHLKSFFILRKCRVNMYVFESVTRGNYFN